MVAKRNHHLIVQERGLRGLYGTSLWRKLAAAQMRRQPMCEECLRAGRVERATAADHVDGFTNYNEFVTGRLQSLCHQCSSTKQRGHQAHAAKPWIGVDGMPVAPAVLAPIPPKTGR
jgi:5-methylcytosine-specific restriction enzyme A